MTGPKTDRARRDRPPDAAALRNAALATSLTPAPQRPLFEGGPPALADGRVHEVAGAAAAAFAAVQAGLRRGPLIWILPPPRSGAERPDPYGLAAFLDPGRLLLVETGTEEEVFWAMEESLRSGAAPCVVAQAPTRGAFASADLTRSRRLQLAAETAGALGLLLLGQEAPAPSLARSSASETRWRAEPRPSANAFDDARPHSPSPVWEWRLLKNKRGPLGRWRLRWRGPPIDLSFSHDPELFSRRPAPDAPHPLSLAAEGFGGERAAA